MTRMPLLVALCVLAAPALAHDHWINKGDYVSPRTNVHCCNANQDCNPVPADQVEVTPAGFFLRASGETIPFDEAIKSEDENYWRCETVFKTTRCFFFPPPGY